MDFDWGDIGKVLSYLLPVVTFILFNVFPPMILLWMKKPIALVKTYTVLGAFFMPFIALMLLILNNNKKLGTLKNKTATNVASAIIL